MIGTAAEQRIGSAGVYDDARIARRGVHTTGSLASSSVDWPALMETFCEPPGMTWRR
jgi:hypothetical protein